MNTIETLEKTAIEIEAVATFWLKDSIPDIPIKIIIDDKNGITITSNSEEYKFDEIKVNSYDLKETELVFYFTRTRMLQKLMNSCIINDNTGKLIKDICKKFGEWAVRLKTNNKVYRKY